MNISNTKLKKFIENFLEEMAKEAWVNALTESVVKEVIAAIPDSSIMSRRLQLFITYLSIKKNGGITTNSTAMRLVDQLGKGEAKKILDKDYNRKLLGSEGDVKRRVVRLAEAKIAMLNMKALVEGTDPIYAYHNSMVPMLDVIVELAVLNEDNNNLYDVIKSATNIELPKVTVAHMESLKNVYRAMVQRASDKYISGPKVADGDLFGVINTISIKFNGFSCDENFLTYYLAMKSGKIETGKGKDKSASVKMLIDQGALTKDIARGTRVSDETLKKYAAQFGIKLKD